MQNNQKISIPLINNSAQRNKSAKVQRHDQSREKFKGYINKQTKDDKKRDQLQGKKQQDLIPTPGQFLVVSNQQHTRSQQVASRQQRSMTGKSISNMGITQQVPVTNKSIVMNASQVRSNVGTGRQNTRLRSSNSVMSNTSLQRNVGGHYPNANQSRQQEQNGNYINLSKITSRNNNSKNGQFLQQNQIKNDNFYEDYLLQQSEQLDASQYALKSNAQPYITTNLKQIINRQHTGLLEKSSKTIQQLIDENVLQEGTTLKRSAVNNERMKKAQIQPLNDSKNSSFMQKSGSNRGLRPITASYLKNQIQKEQTEVSETSEYLKQVINEDKLQNNQKIKTSYIVSRKSLLKNKYIQGYQTVKLTQNDLRNFMKNQQNFQKIEGNQSRIDYSRQSPYIYNDDNAEREIAKRLNLPTKESNNKNQDEERKKGYFLPLDYYNLDDEDGHPEIVMEKYRDPNSGELFGYSKWQLNNGSFEWRRCRVLNYNESQERYMVQWQNGKTKFVSRINLRFEREHEDEFQKKLKAAEYYREMSEMFMKYNFMIESLECNANLPEKVVENIIFYVAGFTIKLGPPADPIIHEQLSAEEKFNYRKKQFKEYDKKELNGDCGKARQLIEKNYSDKIFQELLKEINREFRNGNKRVQFNSSLPFSEERQKLFMGILPDYMFISPVLQGTIETHRTRKSEMGVPDQYYIRYLVLDEKRNQEEIVEKYNFLSYFEKIREDLNRANQDILKRLSDIHLDSILFQSRFLVPENLQEFESVLEFKKIFSNKALEGQRYLGSKIFDHNFDISEIVGLEIKRVTDKNAEIERRYGDAKQREKRAIQMSSQFKTQILRLQRSINYQYEMIGRKQFIDSMELYFSYFNSIMNLYRDRNQENINDLEIDQSIEEVIDEEKLINFIESQKFLSYSSSFKQIKLPFKNILTCKNKLVRNDPEFMIKQAKEQILKNRQLEREKIINEKKEKIEKGELQMDEKTFLEQQALLRKDEEEEILDKDIKIRKFKNNNYVQYDIDLDEWIQEFENVFENVVYLFKTIQCMGINHFEPVRKNNLLKIFENVNLKMVKDEIYVLNEGKAQNESDDDQIIVEYRKRIKGVIGQMRQIGGLKKIGLQQDKSRIYVQI
ncbi:hypothetical protein PPERSA_04518 [Pseudocohnilembus persalinus]|uniref:Uncharacterized protein n=1 Tax=Pseudocohnilembus persalinus TaxID=266149 RepID=A0A0V0QSY4_PSEPJ|nr:hypothetical protein PPERSA_04518 [Pseudocohnilembus persalinus]|eukprot:KRX05481.1 hypothetical protein PPERSA_04518 [Pseudocohnilembus persalinus]